MTRVACCAKGLRVVVVGVVEPVPHPSAVFYLFKERNLGPKVEVAPGAAWVRKSARPAPCAQGQSAFQGLPQRPVVSAGGIRAWGMGALCLLYGDVKLQPVDQWPGCLTLYK